MIYEMSMVLDSHIDEKAVESFKESMEKAIAEVGGEVLIYEDWGSRTLAQSMGTKHPRGYFHYFMYKSTTQVNKELERRLGLNEAVLKFIIVRLGEDKFQETFTREHVNPFKNGASAEKRALDLEKERKLCARKKTCWFTVNKTKPIWKDPNSYMWLINEFGKISPGRSTGVSAKYQRMANAAIKRARCLGLISYMSGRTSY